MAPTERTPTKRSAPLGPESLLWKHIGDRRFYLLFGRIGLLESIHPAVGAALTQHSDFFSDPWGAGCCVRTRRSCGRYTHMTATCGRSSFAITTEESPVTTRAETAITRSIPRCTGGPT